MTQLYAYKWQKSNGKSEENGRYTENFMLWCEKTKDLTNEEWSRAFKKLEQEIEQNKINGKESWAPSYPEFLALTKKGIHDMYLDINDPRHTHYQPEDRMIEDISAEERRMDTGKQEIDKMKAMLRLE